MKLWCVVYEFSAAGWGHRVQLFRSKEEAVKVAVSTVLELYQSGPFGPVTDEFEDAVEPKRASNSEDWGWIPLGEFPAANPNTLEAELCAYGVGIADGWIAVEEVEVPAL